MKHELISAVYRHFYTYKHQIIKGAALVLVLGAGCYISYVAGRHSPGLPVTTSATPSNAAMKQTAAVQETLDGAPSFAFPPYASDSQATPANAGLMSLDLLNLAYLYGDGADTTDSTYSYAGSLYSHLSEMDAKWAAGLNDLYNYTPKRLASQMKLPLQSVTTEAGIIPEFTKVNVQYLNGDGHTTNHTSNARDIIAIVNTLYYDGVLTNMEDMQAYADKLWNASHHYTLHMGDIYYCDRSCQKDAALPETADNSQPETQDTGNADGSQAALGPGMTAESPGTDKQAETPPPVPADTGSPSNNHTDTDNTRPSKAPDSGEGASADEETPGESGPALGESAVGGSAPQTGITVPVDVPTCPGHIDLTITIEVKGASEMKGLFSVDTAALTGKMASGWSGDSMETVRTISSQDWYEKYGINTADSLMRNPLTSADINAYMAMVPGNISQMRKDFIKYALVSVGKIPYYWGGKPAAPGYTGNNFGAIVPFDEDGRFLKGLDCSGWINWLYWSVSGHGLGAESTGTLISSGTATTKSQLIPGDICIRIGAQPHVVVFLSWMADGRMLCIQETSGNINNVEVGITTGDWQSYRHIMD